MRFANFVVGTVSLLLVAAAACRPGALTETGELVELQRGMTEAEIVAAMGRPPDGVRPLGAEVEDWIYVEPALNRTFMVHIKNGRLEWVKMIEGAGQRFSP